MASLTALLVAGGCAGETIRPETQRALDSAMAAYRAKQDRKVIRQANHILRQETRGEGAMQAYYLRGMAEYRLKEYSPAREDLQRVYDRTRNPDLRIKATDTLGELAYLQGNLEEAARYFEEVFDQTPENERPSDHARFRLGCIRQRQGRWADADVHFEKVLYYFPKSKLATQTKHRVRGRSWTIQVGAYKSKKSANAAANRFRRAGQRVYIEPVMRDGKLVFLLQVGRWGQYETAESKLPSIRKLKSDAFLHVAR